MTFAALICQHGAITRRLVRESIPITNEDLTARCELLRWWVQASGAAHDRIHGNNANICRAGNSHFTFKNVKIRPADRRL